MNRVRRLRALHLVVIGCAIGLLIASAVTIVSARHYAEPGIYLLGSGNGLSALIVSRESRVLIANGDNPAALANAFQDARPAMLRRIDLVILAPSASERVAERAVEISSPRRLYALPNQRFHPGNEVLSQTIRRMDGPSTLHLANDVSILIDPGANLGWSITIDLGDARVLMSESVPYQPAPVPDAVIVMGGTLSAAAGTVPIPLIAVETAMPDEEIAGHGSEITEIASGEVVHVRLDDHRLIIDD